MMELDKQLCAIGVNSFRKSVELTDDMGVCDAELVRGADACFIVNPGNFCDDQTGSSFGSFRVIADHSGTGFAAGFGQRASHGRHDDTVFELQFSDFSGLKQFCVSHNVLLFL